MALDTVTIRLTGDDVPLREFAIAVGKWDALVRALSQEIAHDVRIDWVVADLETSSAIATVRGTSPRESAVEQVVTAYNVVGQALATGGRIPYGPEVSDAARGLTGILDGRVKAIEFETAIAEATILAVAQADAKQTNFESAYGAVTGRVQTLTNRGSLRFTVYDLLYDRAVSCYLAEGREKIMRDAWGRLAIVEGLVRRDPATGRPLSIRQVQDVTVRQEGRIMDYLQARGAAPSVTGMSPEQAIRHLRDG